MWLPISSVVFFNTLNTISNQHIWKFNQHGWKALDCTGTGCKLSMAYNSYLLNHKSIDGDMWIKASWCWAENDDVKKIKIQLPKNNGGYKNFT